MPSTVVTIFASESMKLAACPKRIETWGSSASSSRASGHSSRLLSTVMVPWKARCRESDPPASRRTKDWAAGPAPAMTM
ncbi:hypothetical protein D3C73_1081330 [compost metagenome]